MGQRLTHSSPSQNDSCCHCRYCRDLPGAQTRGSCLISGPCPGPVPLTPGTRGSLGGAWGWPAALLRTGWGGGGLKSEGRKEISTLSLRSTQMSPRVTMAFAYCE